MLCLSCRAPNASDAASCIACGKNLYALTRGAILSRRYEILDVLGKGGMGMVYKARDLELNETIALKILRSDLAATPEMAARFRTEIKLARKVSHPNVCRIHDYGREGHLTYIAMEYLEGIDLKQELKARGPLPANEALDIAIEVAEGVDAVHRVGIVHRDLKTSNVMRTASGAVKLMDFGIAKSLGSEDTVGATATGHIIGTPEYMSPEQARAQGVDHRSDVYALGIVIFELFTGDVPFRGDTPLTTLLKHLQDAPPLEGPAAVRLPPALVPVLRKSLDKSRDERHGSVRELIDALKAVRSPPSPVATAMPTLVEALPAGPPPTRPSRPGGLLPWVVVAAAGGVLLFVTVIGWMVVTRLSGSFRPADSLPAATLPAATLPPATTPVAGKEVNADADAPATQVAAREALSRARILDIVGLTQDIDGVLQGLGARVTAQEVHIELQADVLFDFDKADLKPEAETSLGKVAEVLRAQPGPVTVSGHTDSKGAEAHNRRLSENRAASVKDWLVRKASLEPARIATLGFGGARPVAPNAKPNGTDDPQGRQRNRRVEITVRKTP